MNRWAPDDLAVLADSMRRYDPNRISERLWHCGSPGGYRPIDGRLKSADIDAKVFVLQIKIER